MNLLVCVPKLPCVDPVIWFGDIVACITSSSSTLLHVVADEKAREKGEHVLARALEGMTCRTAKVETRLRDGDPATEILAEIEKRNYDMMIVGARGSHGSSTLRRTLLGSVAAQVVRQAPISALVAREIELEEAASLERILVCSGGADVAERVVEAGAGLAAAIDAHATLLHVATPVPSMYTGLQHIEETLPELLRTDTPIARNLRHGAQILDQRGVSAELKLRYGVAADEIIRESYEGNYDLIVVGASKRKAHLKHWILGDVTQQVVDQSNRSVLVVRGPLGL